MRYKYVIFIFFMILCNIEIVYANCIVISSLLPNTDDDSNMEYIELANKSQEQSYLSGYYLQDKSGKTYIFGEDTNISAGGSQIFYRPQTKILLNDVDEEIGLYDTTGNLVDYFTYSDSLNNIPILTGHSCLEETNTGSSANSDSDIKPKFTNTGSVVFLSTNSAKLDGITFEGSGTAFSSYELNSQIYSGQLLGSSVEFLGLQEGTRYSYNFDLFDSFGLLSDSFSGSFETLFSPLDAKELHYGDSNGNGKIDYLDIYYPRELSGSVDLGKIFLYSDSGGLSESRINTQTGFLSSYSISGSVLRLSIFEQDLEKLNLKINSTTSSELRLKTYSGFGLYDIFGNEAQNLTLTSSFSGYANIVADSSSSDISDTSLISSSNPGYEFPEVKYEFQSPTYLLASSGSEIDSFLCDQSKISCKINFTLESSFSGVYKESDFICETNYGSGIILNTCNPPSFELPYGDFDMIFSIRSKYDPESIKTKLIHISNPIPQKILPDAEIIIQSGLDNSFNCSKSDCTVNLLAQIPENIIGFVKCSWNFGGGSYSETSLNSCNPGYLKYPYGDYEVNLSVCDISDSENCITKTIPIHNPMPIISGGSSNSNSSNQTFLTPFNNILKAKITLQGKLSSSRFMSGGIFYCFSKDYCSINLTAGDSLFTTHEPFSFHWDFGNGESFFDKNPKSMKYASGTYMAHLIIKDTSGNESEDFLKISVQPPQESPKELSLEKPKTIKPKEFTFASFSPDSSSGGIMQPEQKTSTKTKELEYDSEAISNIGIILQGKISKTSILKDNSIVCISKTGCSLNFGISAKEEKGLMYDWDFGDGEIFKGSNPKTHKYLKGDYIVRLSVFLPDYSLITEKNFFIEVKDPVVKPKKPKITKLKTSKKPKLKTSKKKTVKQEDNKQKTIQLSGTNTKNSVNGNALDDYRFALLTTLIGLAGGFTIAYSNKMR